ncbi:hypothetical protein WJX72_006522 [[Myrmecia] bisecta]|uniref:Uncharacterized protein n=1 Tax=[Myrmecia] bisecta TaxID=41462 RepID=A0AAW1PYM3_9CHLO
MVSKEGLPDDAQTAEPASALATAANKQHSWKPGQHNEGTCSLAAWRLPAGSNIHSALPGHHPTCSDGQYCNHRPGQDPAAVHTASAPQVPSVLGPWQQCGGAPGDAAYPDSWCSSGFFCAIQSQFYCTARTSNHSNASTGALACYNHPNHPFSSIAGCLFEAVNHKHSGYSGCSTISAWLLP